MCNGWRPSVCLVDRQQQRRPAGLLLCALRRRRLNTDLFTMLLTRYTSNYMLRRKQSRFLFFFETVQRQTDVAHDDLRNMQYGTQSADVRALIVTS